MNEIEWGPIGTVITSCEKCGVEVEQIGDMPPGGYLCTCGATMDNKCLPEKEEPDFDGEEIQDLYMDN